MLFVDDLCKFISIQCKPSLPFFCSLTCFQLPRGVSASHIDHLFFLFASLSWFQCVEIRWCSTQSLFTQLKIFPSSSGLQSTPLWRPCKPLCFCSLFSDSCVGSFLFNSWLFVDVHCMFFSIQCVPTLPFFWSLTCFQLLLVCKFLPWLGANSVPILSCPSSRYAWRGGLLGPVSLDTVVSLMEWFWPWRSNLAW